jgi:hypothetical protein
MPWEWQPRLKLIAEGLGMDFFSSPFDGTAVDFLEGIDVPMHKVASFEIVDIPLLRKIAATGKPVIMSTGMAMLSEVEEALNTLRKAGSGPVAELRTAVGLPVPDRGGGSMRRLYGFGYDAAQLVVALRNPQTRWPISGVTGRLQPEDQRRMTAPIIRPNKLVGTSVRDNIMTWAPISQGH